MALLQYKVKDIPVMDFELSLSSSEYYSKNCGEWVQAKVAFRFDGAFPEISVTRSGQEVDDMDRLIADIRSLVKENKESIDFYPLEPDYNIAITKIGGGKYEYEGFEYEIMVTIDVTGTQRTGVYCGNGPAIRLTANGKSLLAFADELEKELLEIKAAN